MAPKKKPQASTGAAAAAPTPKPNQPTPPPRPLTPRARLLLLIALPLAAAGFLVGCAGMFVLVGPQDLPLVADSAFARAWRALLEKNLFFQPFLFNFGAIASVACAMRLAEDRRAALLLAGAAKRR